MKDMFSVEESSSQPSVCMKRKRRVGKRTIEFFGWGSRPLIEFLEAIGQDTKEMHSRREVATFINKYINDRGLFSAEKKKKVLCDERLYSIFGKKTIPRIKIHDMLEEHFAENHDDSDDELLDSSDNEDYREKKSLGLKNTPMKTVPKTPKSCFAAVIPDNIKLIYLKRSVIQELLKFPESFESKIVGSFIRMKSDPNDIYQKNRFQLQQVTGVEKVPGAGDAASEICLRVSNFFKDVPVCMLSDDDFFEEEVKDVQDRINAGSLNRLIVNELQLKAQVLHADITKNWIAKHISLLPRLIDHANEKGWHRQKFEYIERRKMLQTPSEQEKLLLKVPEVIAEELEPEVVVTASSEKAEENACSPKSIIRGSSDVSSTDASGSGEIVVPPEVIYSESLAVKVQAGGIDDITSVKDPKGNKAADNIVEQAKLIPTLICDESISEIHAEKSGERDPRAQDKPAKPPSIVIDLSDDDSGDEAPKKFEISGEALNDPIWHYLDPQGCKRGPFPLQLLKQWSDANYFHPDFKVWKDPENIRAGVLLVDVLRRYFPH